MKLLHIRTVRQMAAEAGQPYEPPAPPRRGTLPLVDRILSRLPIGCTRVLASKQYGMQFILTANNEIVFRDDELPWTAIKVLADEVNQRLSQAIADHDQRAKDLNRRVEVENALLEVAAGKRPPLSPEECRALAYRLGIPDEYRTTATIR